MEITITDANFKQEVASYEGDVLVDFWAEWCPPCKMMEPVIAEVANLYAGKIKVGKLNVDNNPNIAGQFKIRGIPTLLYFRQGKVIEQMVGAQPRESLTKKLDALLERK